jgi:sister chromatid cohesion protein DCC1
MRLLSPTYLHSLLLSLLLILDSNAYLSDDVPLQDAMAALREDHHVREEVAEAILCRWFGQLNQISSESEPVESEREKEERSSAVRSTRTQTRVVLDGTKLARFIGEQLLREASQPMLLSTLMSVWSTQLGDTFKSYVSLSLLDSLYLLHPAPPLSTSSNAPIPIQRRIEHFPRSALPSAPAPRFQALFSARASWTLQDLAPFIEDLAVDAKRREALLLRFARAKKVEVAVPVPAGAGAQGKIKGEDKGKKAAPQKEVITLYSARVRY